MASDPAFDADALTVNQFCARNGIHRNTFYNEVARGRLTARKCGNRTLVLNDDAKAWRESLPKIESRAAA